MTVCPFTEEETKVFELRRRGKSIIQITIELGMSERTVERRLDTILKKIDKEI